MNRTLLPILLILIPLSAFAQNTVSLALPDASEREVWVASPAAPAPKNPQKVKSTTAEVAIEGLGSTGTIYVLDKTTGNLALKPVAQAKGKWAVRTFDHIGQVIVRVVHGDEPVSAAQIQLKTRSSEPGRGRMVEFLDPSMNGEASFYAIPPGQVMVVVDYKSEGKSAEPVTQVFDLALKRDAEVPVLRVALPEKVLTVRQQSSEPVVAPKTGEAAKQLEEPSSIGRVLSYFLALGVVAAAVYLAYQYMRRNQDSVTSKLEQLGVQIPKPGDQAEPDDLPAPPPPAAPTPPEKILLDDAAPTVIGTPPVAALIVGERRLVSEAGESIPLEEGEMVVGREVGLGLSLSNESTVSRRHASIRVTGDEVLIKDLGSTNGTYVNGARLEEETVLKPGDTVQFGSVRFRYEG